MVRSALTDLANPRSVESHQRHSTTRPWQNPQALRTSRLAPHASCNMHQASTSKFSKSKSQSVLRPSAVHAQVHSAWCTRRLCRWSRSVAAWARAWAWASVREWRARIPGAGPRSRSDARRERASSEFARVYNRRGMRSSLPPVSGLRSQVAGRTWSARCECLLRHGRIIAPGRRSRCLAIPRVRPAELAIQSTE